MGDVTQTNIRDLLKQNNSLLEIIVLENKALRGVVSASSIFLSTLVALLDKNGSAGSMISNMQGMLEYTAELENLNRDIDKKIAKLRESSQESV